MSNEYSNTAVRAVFSKQKSSNYCRVKKSHKCL